MDPTADPTGRIDDLRSAIARIADDPAHYLETDHPVDPYAELAGVYRHLGAGGVVARPTRRGPAVLFNSITGYPGSRILIGLMADRGRLARLLDATPATVTDRLARAVDEAIAPVVVPSEQAPAQQVVYSASDPDFDIRTLLPALTSTEQDAGPFFCLGLLLGSDPDTGHSDVTIHRICVQGRDELSIFFSPGRHIDVFRQRAEERGEPLPVSISMGLDPAVYVGSCFQPPITPLGFDELTVAGGLRGEPVALVDCVSVPQRALARAEVVIEGLLLPGVRMREDQHSNTGRAMPEVAGYTGVANPAVPVMRVTAVTTRRDPILQVLVGAGEEHALLTGLPTEASIKLALDAAMPGLVTRVHAHRAGGGKLLVVLQVRKTAAADDGRARQAALVALGTFGELKNLILVNEDVDIFDTDDVLWAMTTRMQGDRDIITISGVSGHVLDPSQGPEYDPTLPARGTTSKTVYDATYPYRMREAFQRAAFRDVDPRPWAPHLSFPGYGQTPPE